MLFLLIKKIIRLSPKMLLASLVAILVVTSSFVSNEFNFKNNVAHAAFNKQINYQGKLTNASNVTVADGVYHMTFKLYTTATSSSPLWTEVRSAAVGDRATVTNGLFSVLLGSSTPLTDVDFNQTLFLGVEVGGSGGAAAWDGEMTPRKMLGAVPAAFEADRLDGVSSEQFFRNDITNATSTATTSLSVIQYGSGKIAEFLGANAATALSVLSSGNVGVGTSSPYARFSVWGAGTDTNALAQFTNSASTSVMTLLDNGNLGLGTTSPFGLLTVEQGTETASLWVGNNGSSTPSFVVRGVNGNGFVGIGVAAPSSALTIGSTEIASAKIGTLSIGSSVWGSAGSFPGSSSGTVLAVNPSNSFSGDLINFAAADVSRFKISNSGLIVAGTASINGVGTLLSLTPGNNTSVASESKNYNLAGNSITITGTYATQRFGLFGQPTITAVSGLNISSEASTLNIAGAPISAGSATIANSMGLRIAAGTSLASGVTNGYGLYVDAPTGAANNFSGVFLGGNLGVGTTTPGALFAVHGGEYIGGNSFIAGTITSTSSSASTFPYASTTMISATTASSTNLFALNATSSTLGVLSLSAANCDVKASTSGSFYCGTDATGSGGSAFPFDPTTSFATGANSTSTLILLTGGLSASSTIRFGNNAVSGFTFDSTTGNLGLGTTTRASKLSVLGTYGDVSSTLFNIASSTSADGLTSNPIFTALLNGNVGIGTSTPSSLFAVQGSGNFSSNLFVGGTITSTSTSASTLPNASTTNLTISNNTYFAGVGELFNLGGLAAFSHVSRANSTDYALAQSSLGHTHLNAPGNPLSGGIGFHLDAGAELGQLDYTGWTFGTTTRFTSGNVGIGTSTPGSLLAVQGSGLFSSNLFVGGIITSTSSSASTFPYASTTMLSALTASTTNFFGSGLVDCVNTSTFLQWNASTGQYNCATYTAIPTSPGGSTRQIQFNFAGTFGGSTAVYATNGFIGINSTSTPSAALAIQGGGLSLYNTGDFFNGGTITSTSSSASTFPYASTTMISATTASSTNLFSTNATSSTLGVLSLSAANCDVKASTSGSFYCGTDATGSGGFAFPFDPTTSFATGANSTSTLILLTGGLSASSTIRFGNAGVSGFTFDSTTGNLGLGTTTRASKLSVLGTYGDVSSTLFNIASSTSADGLTSNPIFNVLRNGNVGIGTTSPFTSLSVLGKTPTANNQLSVAMYGGTSPDQYGWRGGGLMFVGGNGSVGELGVTEGGYGGHISLVGGNADVTSNLLSEMGGSVYLIGGTGAAPQLDGNVLLGINSQGVARGKVGIGTSTPGSLLAGSQSAIFSIHGADGMYNGGNFFNAGTITSTSSSASTFPYASTTMITATTASTTNLWISGIASGSLLKTTTGGQIIAAVGGTDFSNFAFPFTPSTSFAGVANSTSTTLLLTNGLSASSTIRFGNNAVSGFTFDSTTGNLGLGTTTTESKLSVLGTYGDSASTLFNISSSTSATGLTSNPIFTALLNGNVGVGTSSPFAKLSVQGASPLGVNAPLALAVYGGNAISEGTFGGGMLFVGGAGGSSSDATGGTGGVISIIGGVGADGVGANGPGGSVYLVGGSSNGTAGNVLMGITAEGTIRGKVGIATSTPGRTFAIGGVGGMYNGGNFFNAGTITSTSSSASTFPYASTTALTISGTGYAGSFGIGTSTPGSLLAVQGSGIFSSNLFVGGTITSTSSSASTFPYASTTMISATTASSTNLFSTNATSSTLGVLSLSAANCDVKASTSGSFYCGTDATGSGGGTFPFDPTTSFATQANSTSTLLLLSGGLSASSTIRFGNAGVSGFTFDSTTGRLGLGTSSPMKLLTVEAAAEQSYGLFTGDVNGYQQFNIKNRSSGSVASTDYIITNDIGSETTYYTDLGMNSSGNTDPLYTLFGVNDSYLYSSDMSLNIGTASTTNTNAAVKFFTGGTLTANERMRIDSIGNVGIGTSSPAWKLSVAGIGSFDDYARASYFVATSTTATSTLFGNLQVDNGSLTVDSQNNKVGVGTLTPFATLAVTNTNTALPSFVISTSSINSTLNSPLFFVNATTTGALDWARVAVGTSTQGTSGLRDQFVVAGRIYTTWNEMRCDTFGASLVANISADTLNVCGNFAFDIFGIAAQAFAAVQTSANPIYARLRGGTTATVIMGASSAVRSWALFTAPANNPVMEAVVRTPTVVTTSGSTVWRVGFMNKAVNTSYASTTGLNPQGAYFEASSTWSGSTGASWIAVVKKTGAGLETNVETLVATSTTAFQKMRVELTTNDAIFLINGKVVAKIATNIPTGVNLAPVVSVGAATVLPATNREMDISSIRVWSDDPPGGPGAPPESGPPGRPEEEQYDGVSGAEISEAYLVDNLEDFAGGTVVSIDSEANLKLKRSTAPYEPGLFGVISSSAASNLGVENERTVRVATAGRVPVNVSDEAGNIKPGDYLTSSSEVGVAMKANRSGQVIGRALESFTGSVAEHKGTVLMAIEPTYYGSNHFAFDDNGNLGLGTTSPALKLDVVGDVRSLGFAANSTRGDMTNIVQLQESDYQTDLEKIRNIKVSTFRYNKDTATTTRLGIIADEAPAEILSVSGDVDVYKLATLTLVGVKAQQLKIDSLEARIVAIETALGTATSTTMGGGSGISMTTILSNLESLGVKISESIAQFKNLAADRFSVGSREKPSGITLYDEVNGSPYCLKISNGQTLTQVGECGTETTKTADVSVTPPVVVEPVVPPVVPPVTPPTGGGEGGSSTTPPPETPPATPPGGGENPPAPPSTPTPPPPETPPSPPTP